LLDLPDRERRLGLLDFLHDHLLRLAASLNWDPQPFKQARETVIDGDLRYVLRSPLKASPDRRHRAGVTLEVDGKATPGSGCESPIRAAPSRTRASR
jgi:hypothetical protein